MQRLFRTVLFTFAFGSATVAAAQQPTQELVLPSAADPAVQQFDYPNVVLTPATAAQSAPLAIFLPGTGGRPQVAMRLLNVIAAQGYRVIGLSYNDIPAAVALCPNDPSPACFGAFRAMRTFALGPAPVANSSAESIEGRLVSLLRYLDARHPQAGWAAYLTSDGHPQWSRLLVSGLSQGAGMAAYIAKRYPVYRVVLFSSPWDNMGRSHRPAPWLLQPAATPPEHWWAERHVQEKTTGLLAQAYRVLNIPPSHILLFDQGLAEGQNPQGQNPYHGSTILNPAYEAQWRILYGTPAP